MGLFDNVSASDPDPVAEAEQERAARQRDQDSITQEHFAQVGRDAAAFLLRAGVPSHLTRNHVLEGRVARPTMAWNLGMFWLDGEGSYLVEGGKIVSSIFGAKQRPTLTYLGANDMYRVGYSAAMNGPLPARLDYDTYRPLASDVEINLRHILKGERVEQFPAYL